MTSEIDNKSDSLVKLENSSLDGRQKRKKSRMSKTNPRELEEEDSF